MQTRHSVHGSQRQGNMAAQQQHRFPSGGKSIGLPLPVATPATPAINEKGIATTVHTATVIAAIPKSSPSEPSGDDDDDDGGVEDVELPSSSRFALRPEINRATDVAAYRPNSCIFWQGQNVGMTKAARRLENGSFVESDPPSSKIFAF